MSKQQYQQQLSIEDNRDAMDNYEDTHLDEFYSFIFDQLLKPIRSTPFNQIIQLHLQHGNNVFNTTQAHNLHWLYSADRRIINSTTIYTFRFANACHPDWYRNLAVQGHPHFRLVNEPRHRCYGWYEYVGTHLLDEIGNYLNLQEIIPTSVFRRTNLLINQKGERVDIKFHDDSNNLRLAICFESGFPA
ncbi:unnamed protein product [Adineta steineri]|uniref:Uncharacterized protein n=1 Tax=Adineta steineri TaxID=433720 RepID=A0A819ZXW5_9BILA|nr:unnamed protein product [Adineta steineri]CAF3505667.1 unnamed protein product [Adineta steineri]CAF4169866.1 unnamed protein product [Adineta steineri]